MVLKPLTNSIWPNPIHLADFPLKETVDMSPLVELFRRWLLLATICESARRATFNAVALHPAHDARRGYVPDIADLSQGKTAVIIEFAEFLSRGFWLGCWHALIILWMRYNNLQMSGF